MKTSESVLCRSKYLFLIKLQQLLDFA